MSTESWVYIHGKGGSADEADHYKTLLPGCRVVGLDYRGTTPWETKDEFLQFFRSLAKQYASVSIIANSIGAYFAMNALADEKIERAFFISPIVDMMGLITGMMAASRVTPEELEKKGEIQTPFGETLSWQYFLYAKEHPVQWNVPTHILYGGKDTLTSLDTISSFAKRINASLTVMENGEHWFHTDEQMKFLDRWLKQYL
ncbi:MAG: alpha/beta hydrolase [Elusimicrobiaceae bacterium]|nr:alpha/beta hydrolase [Elusimicrobiaceae bacterium]